MVAAGPAAGRNDGGGEERGAAPGCPAPVSPVARALPASGCEVLLRSSATTPSPRPPAAAGPVGRARPVPVGASRSAAGEPAPRPVKAFAPAPPPPSRLSRDARGR